jgi:anti-anti-sigma factor
MARVGDLEVSVEQLPRGGTLIRVSGELDLATSPELEQVVSDIDLAFPLVFELTGCSFLDSSAVRVLLTTARRAQDAGGGASAVAADPGIRRALEIAGAATILPMHTSLAAAL